MGAAPLLSATARHSVEERDIPMTNKVSLMSPGRIGTLELRNRMFQTAMGPNIAEPDGSCGDRTVAFFEARARGGAALVNMGAVGIGLPDGGVMPEQVSIS